jgi:hypothetical protein
LSAHLSVADRALYVRPYLANDLAFRRRLELQIVISIHIFLLLSSLFLFGRLSLHHHCLQGSNQARKGLVVFK